LSRYFAVAGWPGKSRIHKKLWTLAEQLLPGTRGADYSQAVMDLGATLCTRSKPACEECPVPMNCRAFRSGTVDQYPARKPRAKIARKSFRMLILVDDGDRVLLERRPPSGIWGGLWSLPADDDGRSLEEMFGIDESQMQALPTLKHQLTHVKMHIRPVMAHSEPGAKGVECGPEQGWFTKREWPELGLPKPARQLLETYWSLLK
jgi:A/G-specific adenine glycosylase